MRIQMTLLSDTIFGNGISVPGGEDISVLCDQQGFPYYKGSTFKGIFREELERLLEWEGLEAGAIRKQLNELLGFSGDDGMDQGKAVFSDFVLAPAVREAVVREIGNHPQRILDAVSNLRVFTAMEEDGLVKDGSMRMARCVNQGISFYSEIQCKAEQEALVEEVLDQIKWIGSMRNRGFGKVRISRV